MEFHKENENNHKESHISQTIKTITKDVPHEKPTKGNMPSKQQQQPSQIKTTSNNNTNVNTEHQTMRPNSNSFQHQQNYYLHLNNLATTHQPSSVSSQKPYLL